MQPTVPGARRAATACRPAPVSCDGGALPVSCDNDEERNAEVIFLAQAGRGKLSNALAAKVSKPEGSSGGWKAKSKLPSV